MTPGDHRAIGAKESESFVRRRELVFPEGLGTRALRPWTPGNEALGFCGFWGFGFGAYDFMEGGRSRV